jgi:hypothetical protein
VTIDNSACVPSCAGTQGTILRFRSRIDDANIRTTGAIASYAMKNTGAGVNNHGDLRFYTGQEGDTNERMRISSAGFVGIGTTPGSILHVKGGSAGGADFGAELRVWENSFGAVLQGSTVASTEAFLGNFRYNFNTPANSVTNYLTAGHGILFYDGVHIFASAPGGTSGGTFTPAERLTILNNGNVGIGTTNPTSKLAVAGVVALGNSIDGATNLSYGGRISAKVTTVPGSSSTIIHRGLGSVGYFILVSGVGPQGSNTGRFVDLVYGTGASATPTTLASSNGGTSAPTRTYSLASEKLSLTLSGGDNWTVTTTGLGAMEE